MAVVNQVTLFMPQSEPITINLDEVKRHAAGNSGVLGGESDVVLLGRGEANNRWKSKNDIVIPDSPEYQFVSHGHCSFHYEKGRWFIRDNESLNGIYFQGRKINWLELHDGDKLYIGKDASKQIAILFSCREVEDTSSVGSFSLGNYQRVWIGRDPSCDIVLQHPTVSRQHCVITNENGQYYIQDNNSTNGVILNGHPLDRKTLLQPMDKITIADTTLFYSDAHLYFHEIQGGVSVSAESLFKQVGKKGQEKFITNDVTLSIQPNEFVAIVGGSGAGKTTLLDCLSGMTNFTSGEVLINGESIRTAGKSIKSLIGYVPQQDIVYNELTLERMLYYSAQLRMPKDTTREEILDKIEETLEIVELSEHRDTLISKLSGGQRKRASIAVELMASPKLFFLDEPSSGLDPGTEKHLMQMLKRLSDSGKTVIMVTHTVQNIDLCDRLICMGKGGHLCYAGAPKDAISFFQKQRLTDIYDDLNENAEAMDAKWRQQESYRTNDQPAANEEKKREWPFQSPLVLLKQFRVMATRYAEILKNSPFRMILLLLMPVILTLLVCVAYQADGGLFKTLHISHIRETFPFLVASDTMSLISAFSCAAFWIGIFNSIQEISKERNIFERERFTGVSVLPYVLSKFVILTLLCVVQAAIMTEILWLLSETVATVDATRDVITDQTFGMTRDGALWSDNAFWLELFLTTFMCCLSAMCLGLGISSAVSNDMALVVCPICLLPQILFSGVATKLSGVTKVLSQIITCRWSCIAYLTSMDVNSMYTGYEFKADKLQWQPMDDGTTYLNAAYARDTTYLFNLNPVSSSWVALGIICLVCVTAAIVILRFKRTRAR